ncbi:MAG: hypothetical protein HKN00_07115 [Flavobacteriaceae bacterium]|nr:hypothetical protein [Bacteroidia bacterium]NNF74936.1 hypothetical protein [Flavobacteriaceae bacterium]
MSSRTERSRIVDSAFSGLLEMLAIPEGETCKLKTRLLPITFFFDRE